MAIQESSPLPGQVPKAPLLARTRESLLCDEQFPKAKKILHLKLFVMEPLQENALESWLSHKKLDFIDEFENNKQGQGQSLAVESLT